MPFGIHDTGQYRVIVTRCQVYIHRFMFSFTVGLPQTLGQQGQSKSTFAYRFMPLLWRHNGRGGVCDHQPHDCLLNRLFRRRSKYTSKLRVTGLWVGNSPETGEFPAQMASNAENVSIWWRHHAFMRICVTKLTIIGSDSGLSPDRRQAIMLTNVGILLSGPLGTNFGHVFSFKKMHLKLSSGNWRPFCIGLSVLIRLCHIESLIWQYRTVVTKWQLFLTTPLQTGSHLCRCNGYLLEHLPAIIRGVYVFWMCE